MARGGLVSRIPTRRPHGPKAERSTPVSSFVRRVRAATNLTQEEFCKRYKFGLPGFRSWEQAYRMPRADMMLRLIHIRDLNRWGK